jgi:hypothetical protein
MQTLGDWLADEVRTMKSGSGCHYSLRECFTDWYPETLLSELGNDPEREHVLDQEIEIDDNDVFVDGQLMFQMVLGKWNESGNFEEELEPIEEWQIKQYGDKI